MADLIDGDTTIGLSGFTATFFLGVTGGEAALNAFTFNAIAPEISVAQIPEPAKANGLPDMRGWRRT